MTELTITVRYFAAVREALGEGETLRVPAATTVADLRLRLAARDAAHARALGPEQRLRVAVDQALADESLVLAADAEVAFFPPVTGG